MTLDVPAWIHGRRWRAILSGDARFITPWLDDRKLHGWLACVGIIMLGCGFYGGALGFWHAGRQALYAAIKLPCLILLTTVGNAMLNGMLAQLLGAGLSFRQTSLAILLSFTIMAVILAAFSPLLLFQVINTPALSESGAGHAPLQLMNFAMIAFAGVVGNVRLLQIVERLSPSRMAARRTLIAWLAGNLVLGSQIAWILRPFVGSPGLPIQFLRPDAFRGSFFESLFHSLLSTFGH